MESKTRTIVIDGNEVVVDGSQIKLDTLDLYFGPKPHRPLMSMDAVQAKQIRSEILRAPVQELENLIP